MNALKIASIGQFQPKKIESAVADVYGIGKRVAHMHGHSPKDDWPEKKIEPRTIVCRNDQANPQRTIDAGRATG